MRYVGVLTALLLFFQQEGRCVAPSREADILIVRDGHLPGDGDEREYHVQHNPLVVWVHDTCNTLREENSLLHLLHRVG